MNTKKMSCPVDTSKCPTGSDALVKMSKVGKTNKVSRDKDWNRFYYREEVICKYQLLYNGKYETGDGYNSLNVLISSEEVSAYLLTVDGEFVTSETSIRTIKSGRTYTIKDINKN